MDNDQIMVGDGVSAWEPRAFSFSRDINLEGMSFTFCGQSVPGERLAELLKMTPQKKATLRIRRSCVTLAKMPDETGKRAAKKKK